MAFLALSASAAANPYMVQTAATGEPYTGDLSGTLHSATSFTLSSQSGASVDVVCGGMTLDGTVVVAGDETDTASGTIDDVDWTSCKESVLGTSCTLTPNGLPWDVTVVDDPSASPDDDKLQIVSPDVTIACILGITCSYDASALEGETYEVAGGHPGEIEFSDAFAPDLDNVFTLYSGGGSCPTTGGVNGLIDAVGSGALNIQVVKPANVDLFTIVAPVGCTTKVKVQRRCTFVVANKTKAKIRVLGGSFVASSFTSATPGAGDCAPPQDLAASASCTYAVTFIPQVVGTNFTGILSLVATQAKAMPLVKADTITATSTAA